MSDFACPKCGGPGVPNFLNTEVWCKDDCDKKKEEVKETSDDYVELCHVPKWWYDRNVKNGKNTIDGVTLFVELDDPKTHCRDSYFIVRVPREFASLDFRQANPAGRAVTVGAGAPMLVIKKVEVKKP